MTNPTVVTGVDGVKSAIGQTFGPTPTLVVSQQQIDLFAQATGDHQWIHVDSKRATAESPFGKTIAHGYLTLSLAPVFLGQLIDFQGFSMVINYGCDKVRFLHPVVVDSELSMSARVDAVEDVTGGIATSLTLTFHLQNVDKPACVAQVIYRQYP